jgi:ABC-type cobalamin transport system permease subunit
MASRNTKTRGPRWLYWLVGRFVPNLKETWLSPQCTGNPFGGGYRQDIHLTPAVIWTPWQQSTLATIKELGITTHAMTIGVEWWTWRVVLRFGISTQSSPNADISDRAGEGGRA